MNASSPESPAPHPSITVTGLASVRSSAMTPTTAVSTIAKISAEGMNRSTT